MYFLLFFVFSIFCSFTQKIDRFEGTNLYQYAFENRNFDRFVYDTLQKLIEANEKTKNTVKLHSQPDGSQMVIFQSEDPFVVPVLESYFSQLDRVKGSLKSTTVSLQYINASDVAEHLQKLFGLLEEQIHANGKKMTLVSYKGNLKIVADTNSNSIVVDGPWEMVKKVESVIKSIDTRTPQVLIEVLISEASLNDDSSLGLEWQNFGSGPGSGVGNEVLVDYGNIGTAAAAVAAQNTLRGLKFSILNSGNFEAFLNNIQQENQIKVISRPKILTANNSPANFKATQRNPVLKITNANGVVNNAVEYIDIGVELTVTPRINRDNYIDMQIQQVIQEILGTDVAALSSPIYSERAVKTSLLVKDNHTIILGGLISSSAVDTISKIPFLGHLPLVKSIFQRKTRKEKQTEMLIFITPHIIRDYNVADDFTKLQADDMNDPQAFFQFASRNEKFQQKMSENLSIVGTVVSVDMPRKRVLINVVNDSAVEIGKVYEIVRNQKEIVDVNTHQLMGYDFNFIGQVTILSREENHLYYGTMHQIDSNKDILIGDFVRKAGQYYSGKNSVQWDQIYAKTVFKNLTNPEVSVRVDVDGTNLSSDPLLDQIINDGVLTENARFFDPVSGKDLVSKIVETQTQTAEKGEKFQRYSFKVDFLNPILPGGKFKLSYESVLPQYWLNRIKTKQAFSLNSNNYSRCIYDMAYPLDARFLRIDPEPVHVFEENGMKVFRYHKPKEMWNIRVEHLFDVTKVN